jgi:phosphoglucosamine mutase
MHRMRRLFGTDGVRGVANADLTPDLALALGRAAASVLGERGARFVMGRDTRLSGPMLEGALTAGMCSAGARPLSAGVIPTPAVALLTLLEGAAGGAVISASHNPVADNGIKFFSAEGLKVPVDVEEAIEEALAAQPDRLPTGIDVGVAAPLPGALDRYLEHLLGRLDGGLEGLKVVLDCAHGSACEAGPEAFGRAGAEVVAIHETPDGTSINVGCGSTSLDELAARVRAEGAALGLGFDGDADRVLAVDESGGEVDGDRIIGLLALRLHEQGALKNDLVVTTVMSNLGFRRALEERGIEVVTAPVGDRFVVEAMLDGGAILGGEQSGHVVCGPEATTGDGILTALLLARAVATADESLSSLAHFFEPYPQVLVNVPVAAKDRLEDCDEVWEQVERAESALGDGGRVLLRASGTEPLVRVMVEAADEAQARATAERLADEVRRHLA